jgi:hypothetical protein
MEPLWMLCEMHRWQYNHAAAWFDILDWCQEHFVFEDWSHNWDEITFRREEDYVIFLLRWA